MPLGGLIAILVAVAVAGAVTTTQFRNDDPVRENGSREPSTTAETLPDGAGGVESERPHPVSIPGLIAYEPTGRDLRIGRVLDDTATYTRYFITYRSDDLTVSGILNIPKGDGPWPVLFLNHGYIDPAVYTNGRGLKREQDYFARQGFAVLHSDYRCHADSACDNSDRFALRLGYVKDVINAVAAVQASTEPRLSKTRFGMLGHSMGGGVTLNIMVAKPELIRAHVLYAPVSGDLRDNFERWTTSRPEEAQRIIELYGRPEANPDFWNDLSPHRFFDRVTRPVMVFHGTADASVPIAWSDRTVEQLRTAQKEVDYVVYDGQPHEFTTPWGDFMRRSTDFFRRELAPSE